MEAARDRQATPWSWRPRGALAADQDPERATVVVHASLRASSAATGCQVERGGVIHPETARRLPCTGRLHPVVEDGTGEALAEGRVLREPPSWMMRQLRYRDRECRFPGCGTRRFTQAHNVLWWGRGGRTELENLVLICTYHHKLVHQHRWGLRRDSDGTGWVPRRRDAVLRGPGTALRAGGGTSCSGSDRRVLSETTAGAPADHP